MVVEQLGYVLSREQIAEARGKTIGGPSLALPLVKAQILSEVERILMGYCLKSTAHYM